MKTITASLLVTFFSVTLFGLSSCISNSSIPRQITSLNSDCKTEDIQISDDVVALNGEQTWTAKCNGKTYTCSYLPESGADCYELTE